MKFRLFVLAVASWGIAYGACGVEDEITACREKAGGIYYAYEGQEDAVHDVPAGFEPVYVSHYGRHGSRWPVKERIYKITSDFFQKQQLAENITPEGKRIWKLVGLCAGNADGHLGELTPLGESQHRGIAERLAARFPQLLDGNARVEARSSVEPRCIMSMAAFCERLKELNPGLDLRRHASPGDMDFIHHSTPEAKAMNSDDAPWMWDFHSYRDSVSDCPRTAALLFKNVPEGDSLRVFMRCLYDIGISVQDIDNLDADILGIFDIGELSGLWKASNYMQYAGNGKSPAGESAGAQCAKMLLDEIVTRAEEMLATEEVKVDLRFGHDTDLLRLVSLIDAGGNGVELENAEEIAGKWRNYEISPMAGNFQLIFFRNGSGDVIVMPLLNEKLSKISDVPEFSPGFYDWEVLKIYLSSLCGNM